jgi:hypothetical protein
VRDILQQLWPDGDDGRTFAVLDGARDPRVHPAVERSELAHLCLYTGVLDLALARVAPYLVELHREAPLTRGLAEHWGDAWGIFLRSSAGLTALHRHFRRFLRVRDERGRTLIFRYYDPRVLRAYLPTCTDAELDYVFGPVDSFVLESGPAGVVVAERRPGGGLAVEARPLVRRWDFIESYLRDEGLRPPREK